MRTDIAKNASTPAPSAVQSRALTRRQCDVLAFIHEYVKRHAFAPTLEEIGKALGLRAPATIHKHLSQLESKGLLRRAFNKPRAIELVGSCPVCQAEYHAPVVKALADALAPVLNYLVDDNPGAFNGGDAFMTRLRDEAVAALTLAGRTV